MSYCTGTTATGQRCQHKAMTGHQVCRQHQAQRQHTEQHLARLELAELGRKIQRYSEQYTALERRLLTARNSTQRGQLNSALTQNRRRANAAIQEWMALDDKLHQ